MLVFGLVLGDLYCFLFPLYLIAALVSPVSPEISESLQSAGSTLLCSDLKTFKIEL